MRLGKKIDFWVEQGNDASEAPHHSRRGIRTDLAHPTPIWVAQRITGIARLKSGGRVTIVAHKQ